MTRVATADEWDSRAAQLWASVAEYEPADFLVAMRALVSELPADDPRGPYELGSAYDSLGFPEDAAPLYRQAFDRGITGSRHRQAVIQLASTLRNLGRPEESVALLSAERERESDELDDAVTGFLALALVDVGREREATALALAQLARHLTRYGNSLENYAKDMVAEKKPTI